MSEEELHIKNISLVHRISAVNNMSAQPTWGYLDVSLQLPENLPEWDILPQVKKSTRRPVNLKQLLFCPTELFSEMWIKPQAFCLCPYLLLSP